MVRQQLDTVDSLETKAFVRDSADFPWPNSFPSEEGFGIDHLNEGSCNNNGRSDHIASLLDRFRDEETQVKESKKEKNHFTNHPLVNDTANLESLAPDIFVLLCCNLPLGDIASLRKCSRRLYVASSNQDLWRQKFLSRWNYNDSSVVDWYLAYQKAYHNPHDLWITHWNCVDPCDGLAPGRCCVQKPSQKLTDGHHKMRSLKKSKDGEEYKENPHTAPNRDKSSPKLCPSCRYHPCLETRNSNCNMNITNSASGATDKSTHSYTMSENKPTPILTVARAIETATSLRLEESSQFLPSKPYSYGTAQQTFNKAGTMHRSIDHRQYQTDSLYFLNDLLFFNVYDDYSENLNEIDPIEIKDWKDCLKRRKKRIDEDAEGNAHRLRNCESFESALHSWHLVSVCNPDYNRPIVWKVSVQRSECFTVFPSEGYLLPGESKVITFGIKPFGSLLAYAAQHLNVHREDADRFWSKLYEKESHLPSAPYLFLYQYATSIPCHRRDKIELSLLQQHQRRQSIEQSHVQENAGDRMMHKRLSPWEQSSIDQVSSMRHFVIDAHVHSNYSLSTFRRNTLVPWTLPKHIPSATEQFLKRYMPQKQQLTYSLSPVIYCSPQLMEFYPTEWQRLQAVKLEQQSNQSVQALKYRTEGTCLQCGLKWGPRMEELGQAFVLAKLEGEAGHRHRKQEFERIERFVKGFVQLKRRNHSFSGQNQTIIYWLRKKITNHRGIPWLTGNEAQVLLQWEILTENLCREFTDTDGSQSQRLLGVYRFPTSTDSIYNEGAALDRRCIDDKENTLFISWKEEPTQIKSLSNLSHSPGTFHFPHRFERESTNDLFMNDPMCALKSAFSILVDPRSLLGRGLFDKVPYPGSTFRRCKLPVLPRLEEGKCIKRLRDRFRLHPFISSSTQLTYYQLQESLDTESLLIVNSICANGSAFHASRYSSSLKRFIRNIPSPGDGRFAISVSKSGDEKTQEHSHRTFDVDKLWFLEKTPTKVASFIFDGDVHGLPSSQERSENSEYNGQETTSNSSHGNNFDGIVIQRDGVNNPIVHRGPRLLSLLLMLSSHFGLNVDDNKGSNAVYVNRRILIATHWLSITLTFLPLWVTLFARYLGLVPVVPTTYSLEGLPYEVDNKMRFLTERECLMTSVVLVLFWCVLGRWIERHTGRGFVRAVQEYPSLKKQDSIPSRLIALCIRWLEQVWDTFCPLTLQTFIYIPSWNNWNKGDLVKHVASFRSETCIEHASTLQASIARGGRGIEEKEHMLDFGFETTLGKVLLGTLTVLAGFSITCPHFFLNFLSVLSCSVSLGVSLSLRSLEITRGSTIVTSTRSFVKSLNYVSIAIFGLLIGQLVGSSGGVVFLVEFVFTAVSLLLGGIGTISASGMECWTTFFFLAITVFWGCLLGRYAITENVQKKKASLSSIIVCFSLYLSFSMLTLSFAGFKWQSAIDLVVERPPNHYNLEKLQSQNRIKPTQLA